LIWVIRLGDRLVLPQFLDDNIGLGEMLSAHERQLDGVPVNVVSKKLHVDSSFVTTSFSRHSMIAN
jgi:hypothetical protein